MINEQYEGQEFQEILRTNRKKWNNQIEDLAHHLCIEKGYNPEIENWETYEHDAEQFLRQQTMKTYWINQGG